MSRVVSHLNGGETRPTQGITWVGHADENTSQEVGTLRRQTQQGRGLRLVGKPWEASEAAGRKEGAEPAQKQETSGVGRQPESLTATWQIGDSLNDGSRMKGARSRAMALVRGKGVTGTWNFP